MEICQIAVKIKEQTSVLIYSEEGLKGMILFSMQMKYSLVICSVCTNITWLFSYSSSPSLGIKVEKTMETLLSDKIVLFCVKTKEFSAFYVDRNTSVLAWSGRLLRRECLLYEVIKWGVK